MITYDDAQDSRSVLTASISYLMVIHGKISCKASTHNFVQMQNVDAVVFLGLV